jgi:hypothetical protein
MFNAEMICRFAQVLGVSADDLLGLKRSPSEGDSGDGRLSLKLVRRIKKIDRLPAARQNILLQTINGFLRGEGVGG